MDVMEDLTQAVSNLQISPSKSSPASGPPTTFHRFAKLPPELQLKIWEFSRPGPRAVKLIRAKKCHKYQAGYSRTRNVTSRAQVPSLLHTCIDSRRVALKWYTQSFGWYKDYENTQKTHGPGGIYFDWSRDWVYLQCRECKSHEYNPVRPSEIDSGCGISVLEGVPAFDLTRTILEGRELRGPIFLSVCGAIPNVEQVLVVHPDDGLLLEHEADMAEFSVTETQLSPKITGRSLTESVQIVRTALLALIMARSISIPVYGEKLKTFDTGMLDRPERKFQREWRDIKIDFSFQGGQESIRKSRGRGGWSTLANARRV